MSRKLRFTVAVLILMALGLMSCVASVHMSVPIGSPYGPYGPYGPHGGVIVGSGPIYF